MKLKKSAIIGITIIILSIIGIGSFFLLNKKEDNKSNAKNILYSTEAINVMKEKDLYDQISEKEYNKTVEIMLTNQELNSKYLNDYYQINYQERNDFTTLTNLLLEKSYSAEEINNIFEYSSEKNINKLKELNYIKLEEYIKISNVEVDKIDRYKAYQVANNTGMQDAVTKVNIGLDQEFYSKIETIQNPESYTVLLNKYRALPDDYVPDDLTSLSINSNMKLRKQAADAYEELQAAALLDNVKIIPFSAYRSKQYQNNLYTNYVKRDGKNAADTYSARPRHSEHELGLAIDVRSSTLLDNLTDNDYKWMLNNSYKYGFIVRYAKGTTPITGYIEEPWHLRYVGVDVASDIHEKNITFDEYYDLYLKDKEK